MEEMMYSQFTEMVEKDKELYVFIKAPKESSND